MLKSALLIILNVSLMTAGCDSGRITRVEKQNQELQAEVTRRSAAADYDLQAKCSTAAKAWFVENWSQPDKDTVMLNHHNHYNKKMNKCFVLVEWHYNNHFGSGTSWTNLMCLWDVQENEQYGMFSENHSVHYQPEIKTSDMVIKCEVADKKCSSAQEFTSLAMPYMSN